MKILNNKLIAMFLSCALLLPTYAIADPPDSELQPKITGLKKGELAPYSGVLLNSLAASKLFTEKNYSGIECDLKIKYEVEKESARLQLLLDSTKVSMDAVEQKYTSILTIKNKEIERLSKVASETNDYSSLWFAGGIVAGIITSIAIVYGVKQAN